MLITPYVTTIYIDEYVPQTAELEIIVGEIIKAIRGNPRLHELFFKQIRYPLTIEDKLKYARSFLREIENWRIWVDKFLYWISPEE